MSFRTRNEEESHQYELESLKLQEQSFPNHQPNSEIIHKIKYISTSKIGTMIEKSV